MRQSLGIALFVAGFCTSARAYVPGDGPGNCLMIDFNKNRFAKGETELTAFQKSPGCTATHAVSNVQELERFLGDWKAKTGQDYPIRTLVLSGHALGNSFCDRNLTSDNFKTLIQKYPKSFAPTSMLYLMGCYAGAHMNDWREALPNFVLGFGFEASSPLQTQGSPAWLKKAERVRAEIKDPSKEIDHVMNELKLPGDTGFTFGFIETRNGQKVFKRIGWLAGCNEALDRILAKTEGKPLEKYLEQYTLTVSGDNWVPPQKKLPPDSSSPPTALRTIYRDVQFLLANAAACNKSGSPVKFINVFIEDILKKDQLTTVRDQLIALIHADLLAENFRVCAGPWLNSLVTRLSTCEPKDAQSAALVRKFIGVPGSKPPARNALYELVLTSNPELRTLRQAAGSLLSPDPYPEHAWIKPLGTFKDPACASFDFVNRQAAAIAKCQPPQYPYFWMPWHPPEYTTPKASPAPTPAGDAATHTQK